MPYKLQEQESELEARRTNRFNNESKRVLNKMVKYRMAQKRNAASHKANVRIAEMNAVSHLRHSIQLFGFIQMHYAFCRGKIQDPTTPVGQKRAYHKMAKIIESHFGIEYLTRDNPYFRKMGFRMCRGSKPEAYAFCWAPARV